MQDLDKFKNEMNLSGKNVYVGQRYVPKMMGDWSNNKTYEPLSVVTYQGASYTSRQYVPTGIEITNEDFWVLSGNYNAQVEQYRKEVITVNKEVKEGLKQVNDEVVNARGDEPTLSDRLDKENQEVAALLARKESLLQNVITPRPVITIESDDAFIGDYTDLYPFLKSRGIPGSVAVPSERIGLAKRPDDTIGWSERMSLEQLNELVDNGWSIISHTANETLLGTVSESEVDRQLRKSKEELEAHGFKVEHLNYPSGSYNDMVMRVASKYYKSSRTVDRSPNFPPVKSQMLYAAMVLKEEGNIADIKSFIDAIVADNGWLILYVHGNEFSGYDFKGNDIGNGMKQNLAEIIGYAQSKNVTFLNRDDAWEEKGNVIDLGLYGSKNNTENFVLSKNGKVGINNVPFEGSHIYQKKATLDTHSISTPITEYKKKGISFTVIDSKASYDYPERAAGQLITFRTAEWDDYNFQEYHLSAENRVYRRSWRSGAWSKFTLTDKLSVNKASTIHGITPDTSTDKFAIGISYTEINSANAEGFPEDTAGTLITHNVINESYYPFQEYHVLNSNRIYRRFWVVNKGWSDFELQNRIQHSGSAQKHTIDLSKTPDDFVLGTITYSEINSSRAVNFPEGKAGLLVTNRMVKWGGYPFQEYHIVGSYNVYKRYWVDSTGWSPFKLVSQALD